MSSTHHEFHFGSWFARRVALASGQGSLASKDWHQAPRLGVQSSYRHVFTCFVDLVLDWRYWHQAPRLGGQSSYRHVFARFVDLVLDWHERARQRRALLSLDDRMLRDIGVSRGAAAAEAQKPFWRL
jgi:uncharacterized protein YjiS (DUF1127 family)